MQLIIISNENEEFRGILCIMNFANLEYLEVWVDIKGGL